MSGTNRIFRRLQSHNYSNTEICINILTDFSICRQIECTFQVLNRIRIFCQAWNSLISCWAIFFCSCAVITRRHISSYHSTVSHFPSLAPFSVVDSTLTHLSSFHGSVVELLVFSFDEFPPLLATRSAHVSVVWEQWIILNGILFEFFTLTRWLGLNVRKMSANQWESRFFCRLPISFPAVFN